jgi:hypothetical protein
MSDALGKILGNPARVKLMRLFLLNPEKSFEIKEIMARTRAGSGPVKKEIRLLQGISFLKSRRLRAGIPISRSKHRGRKPKFKKVQGFFLNQDFLYNETFRILLSQDNTLKKDAILKIFKPAGKIKLLLVSGIFIGKPEARVDLLIVGDNLNRRLIEDKIRVIESDLGRELSYSVFETSEFLYRLNMCDKLIQEILDFPHERIVDTLKTIDN